MSAGLVRLLYIPASRTAWIIMLLKYMLKWTDLYTRYLCKVWNLNHVTTQSTQSNVNRLFSPAFYLTRHSVVIITVIIAVGVDCSCCSSALIYVWTLPSKISIVSCLFTLLVYDHSSLADSSILKMHKTIKKLDVSSWGMNWSFRQHDGFTDSFNERNWQHWCCTFN